VIVQPKTIHVLARHDGSLLSHTTLEMPKTHFDAAIGAVKFRSTRSAASGAAEGVAAPDVWFLRRGTGPSPDAYGAVNVWLADGSVTDAGSPKSLNSSAAGPLGSRER
jgi:prepilin-type processing-associated H-X9-DG protein